MKLFFTKTGRGPDLACGCLLVSLEEGAVCQSPGLPETDAQSG